MLKEGFPYLRNEAEYTIYQSFRFMFNVLAAELLLQSEK